MERLTSDSGVRPWSASLSPEAPMQAAADPAPVPDHREALAQERLRVLEAARDEGYAAGMRRAEEEIRKAAEEVEKRIAQAHAAEDERLAVAGKRLQQLLRSMQEALSENDDQLESLAIEIAFAAVVRALGQAAADRSLIPELCRQALLEYQQRPAMLRVAADDVATIAELACGDDVRVVADPRLASGQCRLETHKGVYDTSVDVRLDAIRQAFLKALASGGADA